MNRVFFSALEVQTPPWIAAAENFAKSVMNELGLKNWDLSVLFCSNRYIKSLNAMYRKKDEATDVLSFAQGETGPGRRYMAGDIVISLEALEENSRVFKVSRGEELRRLMVHGILHLSGKDHKTNNCEEDMLKTQEEILSRLGQGELVL